MVDEALVDLTQDRTVLRTLYAPSAGAFAMVDVPGLPFAVLDGEGPPSQSAIGAAVRNLYTAIYVIRRQARERMGKSFVEAPVEVLYWAEDMRDLAAGNRENWHWRVQITLPVWSTAQSLRESVAEMRGEPGASGAVRWEISVEGRCVQYLHIGQTSALPRIIERLYGEHLPKEGLEPDGPYHEIYLDDWNRVSENRRKIILRQPVRAMKQAESYSPLQSGGNT